MTCRQADEPKIHRVVLVLRIPFGVLGLIEMRGCMVEDSGMGGDALISVGVVWNSGIIRNRIKKLESNRR